MSLDIREFRYYQFLGEQGLVDPIICFADADHGPMYANIFGEADELVVFCLFCDSKLHPGLPFEERIKKAIATHTDDGK